MTRLHEMEFLGRLLDQNKLTRVVALMHFRDTARTLAAVAASTNSLAEIMSAWHACLARLHDILDDVYFLDNDGSKHSKQCLPPSQYLKLFPPLDGERLVQGSGIVAGVVSTCADANGVTVRLDDNENPAFWAAAWLARHHLVAEMQNVDALRAARKDGGK